LAHFEIPNIDVAVLGFGPAGMAFTCAVADHVEQYGRSPVGQVRCFEKSSVTTWHGGFLLPQTDINHHVFRDLVTPRNPRSRFSFAMYLKSCDRLYRFGLLGRPPSRVEWSDYLTWTAAQLAEYVGYGEEVRSLSPVIDRGRLSAIRIVTSQGAYQARSVVLSSGSTPRTPELFSPYLGGRIFHTSDYLPAMDAFADRLPRRWLVVGSGQSAGEAVADLLRRSPDVSVESVHRSVGFKVAQLGQFPNLAFLPDRADYFHQLAPADRRKFFAEVKEINYAGIDADESAALYSQVYEDSVRGRERLHMSPFTVIESVSRSDDAFEIALSDLFTGDVRTVTVDAVVLGTGFEQLRLPPLLAELLPWIQLADDGGLLVGRDYQAELVPGGAASIYLNGLSERSHGIGAAQSFSLLAMRSERILESLSRQTNHAGSSLNNPSQLSVVI
jgi:L-ornithine N5-monooxygenase